jgi:hypothetical protein
MRIVLSLALVIGIAGCPGSAPPNNTGDDTPDAGTEPDAPVSTSSLLSGTVMDYFGATAVQDAELATDGLDPPLMTTSNTEGAYELDVAIGSALFVVASKTAYRPTRNAALTVADMPVEQDVYVMTEQDVKNQYTAVGALPATGTAILIAEIRKNDGTPLEGIPPTNVQLLDATDQPVAGVLGPYFFNDAGAVDAALLTATAYNGKSRVAILDVPPGNYTLSVTYTGGNGDVTNKTSVTTLADGATLAINGGTMGGGGNGNGGGDGAPVTDPSFATHIYPKLQRAALGGLGCANCHTAGGPAAILKYDEAPGTVLANITAAPGVINATTPADSLLLVRPLYEQPPLLQDHPNATFLDINDPDYKLFLLWITNRAKP